MTHVKAREWIKRLPEGRGHPLDAGAKLILMELWDRVDWSRESDSPARDCYPCRRRLAEDTGTTPETVKSRLARLSSAGWIRREADGWALAWARPWPVEPGDARHAPGDASPDLPSQPGGSVPLPRVMQAPPPGDASPDHGGSVPRPRGMQAPHTKSVPSQYQVTDQPSDHATPSTPTDPIADHLAESGDVRARCPSCDRDTDHVSLDAGRRQCSACGGLWSAAAPDGSHMQDTPTAQGHTCKTAKRRSVRKAPLRQEALAFDGAPRDPEGAIVEALLAEHDRLRRAALERHGDAVAEIPKPGTRDRKAMTRGCRQVLRERGEDWCRTMLAWRGAEWLADASQLAWSTTSVWTSKGIAAAVRLMGGPARASPRRSASMLSAPIPSGPAPEFTLDESDDQCLL